MNEKKPDRVGQVFAALGKSVCYVALFLGMQVAVMLPLIVNAITKMVSGDMDGAYDLLNADAMLYTLLSGLLTIAVVLAFYLIRRKKLSEALWLRPVSAPALFSGAAVAPGLYLIIAFALALLPEAWQESYGEASANLGEVSAAGLIAVVVVAPVLEEFIFRGLVLNRLSRVMPWWLAVVLSAAVFGACHGHPVWFCYAFVLGSVFGFIVLRTGSIVPTILAHVVFNGIGQIFSAVPETEEGTELLIAIGVLLAVAIVAPILDRKGIAALFRSKPKGEGGDEPPAARNTYDYDPWEK